MTKELREILATITAKKEEAAAFIENNDLQSARKLKEEIENLREQEINLRVKDKMNTQKIIENAVPFEKNKRNKIGVEEVMNKTYLNVVRPNEKLSDTIKDASDVQLGDLVTGMVTGKWKDEAREYYNTMQTGGNKVIIPTNLSATILDLARAKSAIMGKILVVPMENGNLTIGKLTKDVTGAFVAEGEIIPTSGAEFKGIKLEAKTVAVLVPVSEKILQDAPNITEVLMNSIGQAIASAVDKAILYGTGTGAEGDKEIKGVTTYGNINKVSVGSKTNFEYDDITKAIKPIKKANFIPNKVVMSTDELLDLQSAKDTLGQYITPPVTIQDIELEESNNINMKEAIAFDENSLILGVQGDMQLEIGHMQGQFEKIEKAIRAYVRLDVAVVQEQGISHMTREEA